MGITTLVRRLSRDLKAKSKAAGQECPLHASVPGCARRTAEGGRPTFSGGDAGDQGAVDDGGGEDGVASEVRLKWLTLLTS
jgi:hypothetical protein